MSSETMAAPAALDSHCPDAPEIDISTCGRCGYEFMLHADLCEDVCPEDCEGHNSIGAGQYVNDAYLCDGCAEGPHLKVLDLFAGLRGWSQPFADRGHETFSIELDKKFPDISLYADILKVRPADLPWAPDIVLASPPCQGFSVMQIGRNWTHDHQPKTETAVKAQAMVRATLALIDELKPRWHVIENPRAKLRKMPFMEALPRATVTYCQYGEHRMKPTDLWGNFPPSLTLAPPCTSGAPCHISAPRGSRTGSQGMDSALSAKIPYDLALAVCKAAEADFSPN